MNFGLVGLEGFVGPEGRALFQAPDPGTKPKVLGSGFGKQERSGSGEDDWRNPNLARTDELSASKTMPLHQSTPLFRSNSIFSDDCHPGQRMLSFSTPRLEVPLLNKDGGLVERSTQNLAFPFYQQSSYSRNTGIGSGSFNGNMHGPFAGVRAPFTPSQWIELEHQALIYKYITANVPVPSNLLIPIKRSFNPFGLSGSYAGSLYPNSLGWGSFHLGLASSTDPEPGRCRRTDGKKWRCSRDAVADQKYCERHINRGRHRSRKPVEGQSGHAVSGRTNSKVALLAPPLSASVIPNCGASNSLAIAQNQLNELQPGAANPAPDVFVNRLMLNKGNVCDRLQDRRGLSAMSPNVKSRDGPFSMPKLHNPFEESSESVFGFVSSDSLLNPSQKSAHMDSKSYTSDSILSPSQKSAFMDCKSYCSFLDFNDQESQDQQHPLRQFIEDWPKDQSDRSTILWPEELKSDWTQLSMAIPVATDFSSSSSSPMHERLALSPLRLSRDLDTFQIGLGVSSDFSELTERQTNWIPIPWGTSMGGPLGEALNNTTNTLGACKKSSALNLTTEEWDGSPQMESSPTGVLQKTTFGSLSNSSSGSSPRTENNKTHEGATFCDGSTLGSSSIPSLQ